MDYLRKIFNKKIETKLQIYIIKLIQYTQKAIINMHKSIHQIISIIISSLINMLSRIYNIYLEIKNGSCSFAQEKNRIDIIRANSRFFI